MAVAYVRQNHMSVQATTGTNTSTVTLTTGATRGNLVVAVFCGITSVSAAISFSDSKGNTWQTDSQFASSNVVTIASTNQDVGALTSSDTVTATTASGTFSESKPTWILELSGVDLSVNRANKQRSSSNAGGTSTNTGSLTPTCDSGVLIAVDYHDPTSSVDTINAATTVGTYLSPATDHGYGTSRSAWCVYRVANGGIAGVAQKHAWTWSSSASGFVGTSFVIYQADPSCSLIVPSRPNNACNRSNWW